MLMEALGLSLSFFVACCYIQEKIIQRDVSDVGQDVVHHCLELSHHDSAQHVQLYTNLWALQMTITGHERLIEWKPQA